MKKIFETLKRKWAEYLLEIIVITAGILAAYALDGWKETRQDRQIEESYLNEINIEFKQNRNQIKTVTEFNKGALASVSGILKEYSKSNPNPDSLLAYHNNAYHTYTFDPSQSSIKALINTSSLHLIRNNELRRLLVSWDDLVRDYQQEELFALRHSFDQLFPYMARAFDSQAIANGNPHTGPIETEFRNILILRESLLNMIFKNDENELLKVQETMDRIIELTDTHD